MNWAWGLPLKPSVKFVLLALADASDDAGYCWPSIPTLAKKTCLDPRSVQRILNHLKTQGFLQVERRQRTDGSPTSNGYRLRLNPPPGKMSPPPGTLSPPGDTGVTLTITEPPREPKPPQPPPSAPTGATADGADGKEEPEEKHTENRGCGELIFPKTLSARELRLAQDRLAALPRNLAQDVLDELTGRLAAQGIRGSPLSYLRALIARAQTGQFTPEAGVKVAQAREGRRELPSKVPPVSRARNAGGLSDPSSHLDRMRQVLSAQNKPRSQWESG